MNTHDKLELPPLRTPDLEDELTAVLCAAISWGGSVISSEEYVAAKQRFRAAVNAAIEADRQQRESIVTDDMRSAIRFAPFSAHWSNVLQDIFGPDAREGIDALERRLRDIEADRKRRGDPVGWMYEDELPNDYPYEVMYPYSKVDVVRMFPVFAPQPAEPVKVPSDLANRLRIKAGMITMGEKIAWGSDVELMLQAAQALENYGQPAQPAEPLKVPSEEQIADIVRDHLTAVYACNRTWSAWSYNTMSQDDFVEASETEMADEIAAAIVERYGQPAQPAASAPPVTEQEEEAWQQMEKKQ